MLKTLTRSALMLAMLGMAHAAVAQKCGEMQAPAFTNLCAGLSTSTAYEQMYRMEKPALRQAVRDRSFGSKIIRITDAGEHGVIKPVYSTIQAWNADESLLLLYANRGGVSSHELYDGRSYEWRSSLDINPGDMEELFWHSSDPDVLFFIDADRSALMHYSVEKARQTVHYSFKKECQNKQLTVGGDPHMPSWDSRYIGLRCGGDDDERALLMVFDIEEKRLVSKGLTGVGDGDGDRYHAWTAPAVAPSGERLFLQGDVSGLDLKRQRELALYSAGEHSSLGKLPSGHDALFAVGFDAASDASRCDKSIGALVAHDLQTGECKVVIGPSTGHGYPPSGTHLSALSYRNPGWVALSSVGEVDQAGAGKLQKLFNQEIYLAYTDPKNTKICRVAHHRSHGRDNSTLDIPYFAEPHVSISPSGTRLIFGSDWHGGNSVDSYVVELPSYRACEP